MWLKTIGSALAGAAGFFVGFYAGLYLVLSIWGLDADAVWYPVMTVGVGSLVAGVAVAATVSGRARPVALATALAVGAVVIPILVASDADYEFSMLAGVVLTGVAAVASRAAQAAEA